MKSLMHWLRLLVLISFVLNSLTLSALAQPTTLDPELSKIANKKLSEIGDKVNQIKEKTKDAEAKEKQIQKVADKAAAEGTTFIEDAGNKRYAKEEEIERVAGQYVLDLVAIVGAHRLCPFLARLLGPGGKREHTIEDSWSKLREIYRVNCSPKTTTKPPGGIKIGGGIPGDGNTPGGGGIPISDGGPCPEGYPLLEDCVKEHNLTVCLYGDGQTTSNCTLSVTDQSGHTSTAQLKTVCASKKSLLPPISKDKADQQNLTYTVVTGKNPRALSLVNTAKELEKQGKFDDVHINQDKRCSTISQLAIWKDIGGSTPGNKDSITNESIKKDLLHKSGVNPKTLTKDEDKQLTNRVDAICAAVDLTLKESAPEEKTQEEKRKEGISPNILIGYHHNGGSLRLAQVKTASGHCCIPAGTVFVPNKKDKYQEMMCVEDQAFPCPPGISDGQIADNCNWVFAKQLILPKNPYKPRTEGTEYDQFEKEQSNRITDAMERLCEVEAEFIDEDEAAQADDKFKESNIVLIYLCVDKTGHARSARHVIVPDAQKKYWDPEGDLDVRKTNKDGRKTTVKDNRPK